MRDNNICPITEQSECGRIQYLLNNKVLGETVLHNGSLDSKNIKPQSLFEKEFLPID